VTERLPPLARLFAMAFRDLVDGLHAELGNRGWADVRPVHGFVLFAAAQDPPTVTEVGALLGVSKQAAAKLLEQMVAAGYLHRSGDATDARLVRVAPTPRGRELLAAVEEVYAGLEARWGEVIGPQDVELIRSRLDTVLRSRHGGRLPAVRPTW